MSFRRHWLLTVLLFLVVAFCLAKMPDSYSDFFLQTSDRTLKGPLFTETSKTTEAKSGQRKLSGEGPPFIFFRNCATFLKIFQCLQRPPFEFFDILLQNVC